jgi:hypothetical protein
MDQFWMPIPLQHGSLLCAYLQALLPEVSVQDNLRIYFPSIRNKHNS